MWRISCYRLIYSTSDHQVSRPLQTLIDYLIKSGLTSCSSTVANKCACLCVLKEGFHHAYCNINEWPAQMQRGIPASTVWISSGQHTYFHSALKSKLVCSAANFYRYLVLWCGDSKTNCGLFSYPLPHLKHATPLWDSFLSKNRVSWKKKWDNSGLQEPLCTLDIVTSTVRLLKVSSWV